MFQKNIPFEVGSSDTPIREQPGFQKLIKEELKKSYLLLINRIDRYSRNNLEFCEL